MACSFSEAVSTPSGFRLLRPSGCRFCVHSVSIISSRAVAAWLLGVCPVSSGSWSLSSQFQQDWNCSDRILPPEAAGGTAANKRRGILAGQSDERLKVGVVSQLAEDACDAAADIVVWIFEQLQGERCGIIPSDPDEKLPAIETELGGGIRGAGFGPMQRRFTDQLLLQLITSGRAVRMPSDEFEFVQHSEQLRVAALLGWIGQEFAVLDHVCGVARLKHRGTEDTESLIQIITNL